MSVVTVKHCHMPVWTSHSTLHLFVASLLCVVNAGVDLVVLVVALSDPYLCRLSHVHITLYISLA